MPSPARITIAYSNRRGILEKVLKEQQKLYPKSNAKLSGRPGEWKVRRDLQPLEDYALHEARDMRRSL